MKRMYCATICLCVATAAHAQQTTGWRMDGTGRAPDATLAADFDLNAGTHVRWRTDLPASGVASPVITGDRVLVVVEPDILLCFGLDDGSRLWESSIGFTADEQKNAVARPVLRKLCHAGRDETKSLSVEAARLLGVKKLSAAAWSTPTPCTDGTTVWTALMHGVVAAVSLDGTRQWRIELDRKTGPRIATSPLLVDGQLVLATQSGLLAVDPATGQQRWFTPYRVEASHPATPGIWRAGGKAYLVGNDRSVVRVVDGAVVQDQVLVNLNPGSPAIVGDRAVFIHGGAYGRDPQLLDAWDLALDGDRVAMTLAWTGPDRGRGFGIFSSATPLIVDGTVVHAVPAKAGDGKKNALRLLRLADGTVRDPGVRLPWECGGHNWWPSPIQVGPYVVSCDLAGRLDVLKRGRPWELVNTQQFGAPIRNAPAAAGHILVVRTDRELVCIGP